MQSFAVARRFLSLINIAKRHIRAICYKQLCLEGDDDCNAGCVIRIQLYCTYEGLKYSSPSEFWNSCLQPEQWCFLAPLIIQTFVCSDNSPFPGWLDIRGSTIHEKLMDMLKRTSV